MIIAFKFLFLYFLFVWGSNIFESYGIDNRIGSISLFMVVSIFASVMKGRGSNQKTWAQFIMRGHTWNAPLSPNWAWECNKPFAEIAGFSIFRLTIEKCKLHKNKIFLSSGPKHNTIDRFATLTVLTKQSQLPVHALYCSFVDLKKALAWFLINIRKRIEQIGVSDHLMATIVRLHEKV